MIMLGRCSGAMGRGRQQGIFGVEREKEHDVVAYQISCREFCEGFEGSTRGGHAGQNHEGTRDEKLFGGKGAGSCGERGCMESRAWPKRGRNFEAGSSVEDGKGESREGKERFDGNSLKSRSARWCLGNYC